MSETWSVNCSPEKKETASHAKKDFTDTFLQPMVKPVSLHNKFYYQERNYSAEVGSHGLFFSHWHFCPICHAFFFTVVCPEILLSLAQTLMDSSVGGLSSQ